MTTNDNSQERSHPPIVTASCKNPFDVGRPLFRVSAYDFENTNNPAITLECLETGQHFKSTLHAISVDPDFIKAIDSESCYRLGYMRGAQQYKSLGC